MKKLAFTILLICTLTLAQPGHFGGGHEKARMMKKWKLIEYLDLFEEQSEKFFLRINYLEKELKAFHKNEKKVREGLYEMLEDESINEKKAKELIADYYDLKKEITDLLKVHHYEIGDVLSTEQQVKYALFEHQFKKKMKDKLLDKKGKWTPGMH